MAQYWYLGARVKESNANATGRIRQYDVARWINKPFATPTEAAQSAVTRMAEHPGVAYFVQGFERRLIIDADGYSHGFEEVKEGLV